MERISSLQNPRIKNLLKLEKSSERKQSGTFITEGYRELKLAAENHFELLELYICEEVFTKKYTDEDLKLIPAKHKFVLSPQVFEKIAYREGSDGLIALIKAKALRLSQIKTKENPLVVVLEQIEKPGNAGAILRTCDAAGVDLVFLADPITDLYNPNLIRASLGSVFSLQIVSEKSAVIKEWLIQSGFNIFSALVDADQNYFDVSFAKASAIVMGSEAHGLSKTWRDKQLQHVRIPMQGQVDSLNVANAFSILVFEALRQRLIIA